ncbi:MAG: type I asparaginase [Prevotella sp.]|nr:type I asparaginase [Prevotella sp.]
MSYPAFSPSSPPSFSRTNKVLLIYTGGTIGMGSNPVTHALEPLDFSHLVENLPEFRYISTDIDTYHFNPPVDSSDMAPPLWAQLVRIISENYDNYDGFVILHGTDTMAYTASALSFMLENLTKPVILTGSQLPIGQLRTDGKENLLTAIELASDQHDDGRPRVPEVCIYFGGRLLRGNRSTKQSSDGFDAFNSFNHPVLCHAGVNFTYHEHHILTPDYSHPMIPHTSMDSNVIVLSLFPGIQECFLRHVFHAPELRSVVMRTFGSGNAPRQPWLLRLLFEASQRGVTIVNISQCMSGCVEMDRYDTGLQLKEAGVVSGHDSTVEGAVTKLMYLQALHHEASLVRRDMNRSLAGEITL